MRQLLIYTSLLLFVLSACTKGKESGGEEPIPPVKGDTPLTFTVSLPAQAQPQVYALNEITENDVSKINVFVFKENGGELELVDWASAADGSIENVGGSTNKKRFKVSFTKLEKNSHQYQFVVLANAKVAVDDLFGTQGVSYGAKKEVTLEKIKMLGVERWITDSSLQSHKDIPMWGESPLQQVGDHTSLTGLKLLRMVAKINVTLDALSGVRGVFKLKSVDLYNFHKDGYIAPHKDNLVSGTTSKVALPTQLGVHTKGPIVYDATNSDVTDTEMINEIYTFESKVPYNGANEVELDNVTCIVVGGDYNSSGVTTYYRIDLARKNAQDKYDYLDILRNHNYKVNITKANGKGYDDSDEAFRSRATNLEMEVEAWDDESLGNSISDGQYELALSRDSLGFYAEGRESRIKIYTDHEDGWSVESTDKPGWITLSPDRDNSYSAVTVTVTATALSAGEPNRNSTFTITAGRMKKKVKVTQLNEAELSLVVSPENLVFRKSGSQPKPIDITTFPEGLTRTFTNNGNISWAPGYDPENDLSGLSFPRYSFKPNQNNTGLPINGSIVVTVEHNGRTLSKTISVHQMSSDLNFAVEKPATYPAQGGERSFKVQSDTRWQLSTDGVSDPLGMITLLVAEEQDPNAAPVEYKFMLSDNTTYAQRVAKFYAKSSDIDFVEQEIEIKQAFRAPLLSLPVSTVDFGVSSATKPATVQTNAGWVMVSQAANIADVITNNDPIVGAVQAGSTNALVDATGQILFTPSVAYVGLPKAGTVLTSYVTLETRNHDAATMATKTLTLTRSVPQSFEGPTIVASPAANLSPAGHNIVASASTNEEWYVEHDVNTTNRLTQAANSHALRSQTLVVPARPIDASGWTINRAVNVSTWCKGGAKTSKAFTQLAYTLTTSGNNIPATVASTANNGYYATMATTTATPSYRLRIMNTTTGSPGTQIWTDATASANIGNRYYQLPAHTTWGSNRTVSFQYERAGSGWIVVKSVTQTGYSVSYSSGLPTTIPKIGGTYNIVFTSTGSPSFAVRAVITGTSTVVGGPTTSTTALTHSITIPDINSGFSRSITVQTLQGGTWVNATSATQAAHDWHSFNKTGYWVQKGVLPGNKYTYYQLFWTRVACSMEYGAGWRLLYADGGNSEENYLFDMRAVGLYTMHFVPPFQSEEWGFISTDGTGGAGSIRGMEHTYIFANNGYRCVKPK